MKAFTSRLQVEHSNCSRPIDIGLHENTMEWFPHNGFSGIIEWCYWPAGEHTDCEVVHIGIELRGNRAVGYDGVFSLPKEAIDYLQELGFDTSEVI